MIYGLLAFLTLGGLVLFLLRVFAATCGGNCVARQRPLQYHFVTH